MKNVKVINYCWTCNKEHDLSDRKVDEYNIRCECGGVVISPSGKSKFTLVPTVKVFKINDGESHWIAANTQNEAEAWYRTEWVEDEDMGYTINELSVDEIKKLYVNVDESESEQSVKKTLFEIVANAEKFPCLLATTVS